MPGPPGNLMHKPLPRTDSNFPRRTLQSSMVDRQKIMQERSRGNRNYENEDMPNTENIFFLWQFDPIPDNGLP